MAEFTIADFPSVREHRVVASVDRSTETALRRGHPWVFDNAIERLKHAEHAQAGDLAIIFDRKNRFLAAGLYDPSSPIRIRALVHKSAQPLTPATMQARACEAGAKRVELVGAETDGYRMIHGPGDGFDGIVVDRYADTAVIKVYSEAWAPWLPSVVAGITSAAPIENVILRTSRNIRTGTHALARLGDGAVLCGSVPADATFVESGLRFEVDPVRGQKTGFFLDQRENRRRVETLSSGKRVMNVFSYTGGFSLYAARGGATRVVSVDASRPATDAVARNFKLNADDPSISACANEERCGDAFALFREAIASREVFDVVIVDPPSFAKRASEVESALEAYSRLARLAAQCVAPGGTLVFASCSSRVGPEQLDEAVRRGVQQARRSESVFDTTGHAPDHPITVGMGQYLKCRYAVIH